jgi:hypothetical protein
MPSFGISTNKLLLSTTITTSCYMMATQSFSSRGLRIVAQCPKLAISEAEDDPDIRAKYRPFLLDPEIEAKDWISQLELESVIGMSERQTASDSRLKILVLYGSLRKRYLSFPLLRMMYVPNLTSVPTPNSWLSKHHAFFTV